MGVGTAVPPCRLIRHMTASSSGIEDVVSDFLFVLCKESVRRFIKHVGYGHAAGLLMSRGLLGGGASPNVDSYSPDEDSDTEEYKESVARWAGRVGVVGVAGWVWWAGQGGCGGQGGHGKLSKVVGKRSLLCWWVWQPWLLLVIALLRAPPLPSPLLSCSVDPVTGGPGQRQKPSESMTAEEQEVEARKLEDAIARLNRWEESVAVETVDYSAVNTCIVEHTNTSHHITSHHITSHHITGVVECWQCLLIPPFCSPLPLPPPPPPHTRTHCSLQGRYH